MPSMLHCLQALGYIEVETQGATVLGPPGLRFRGHQFRYSELRRRKMSSAATGFIVVAEARRFVKAQAIDPSRFEFQMLYGIRRDLQEQLVKDGFRMRVYVPFGTQWYPYLMRRLAERPANVAFITGNVMREMLHGRQ